MTLLQFRYVIAIADAGLNISAAASRLCTSQPGVSKQLKLLEEELGVLLFVRHGRSLRAMTPAGRQIVEHARIIMQEVEGLSALRRAHRQDEPFAAYSRRTL